MAFFGIVINKAAFLGYTAALDQLYINESKLPFDFYRAGICKAMFDHYGLSIPLSDFYGRSFEAMKAPDAHSYYIDLQLSMKDIVNINAKSGYKFEAMTPTMRGKFLLSAFREHGYIHIETSEPDSEPCEVDGQIMVRFADDFACYLESSHKDDKSGAWMDCPPKPFLGQWPSSTN